MSVRIKRHWFREDAARSPEQMASVIAVAIWKSAGNGLQTLRRAHYEVEVGAPYLAALAEFLVFLIVAADRIAYRHDAPAADSGDGWRRAFTVALAKRIADIYQENLDHLVAPDPAQGYRRRFIDLLNRRMDEYGEFDYAEGGADFGFLRYFGSCVEQVLDDVADRQWAVDQVMTVQGPEALELLERGLRGVLGIDPKPRVRSLLGGD
jgi:hypothetical protein